MSFGFGFGVGDFLVVLKIADKARRTFVDAPGQLTAISDDVKRLSNIFRSIDGNDPAASLGLSQQNTLNEISRGCQDTQIDSFRRRIDSNVAAFELFLTEAKHQLSRETNDIVTVTQAGVNQLVQAQDEQRRRGILD
ncbi:hypothetical protein BDW69DRAFT_180397 [Aspergillus filifer]